MRVREHVENARRPQLEPMPLHEHLRVARERRWVARHVDDAARLAEMQLGDRRFGARARRIEHDDVPVLAVESSSPTP